VVTQTENELIYKISQRSFKIKLLPFGRGNYVPARYRRVYIENIKALGDELRSYLESVWLPVSRRLPIPEEYEEEFSSRRASEKRRSLESVDDRLKELIDDVANYRLELDGQLSALYKTFERKVLDITLYDKTIDRPGSGFKLRMLTDDEKDSLVRAFKVAGLWDTRMQRRIDEHFQVAAQAFSVIDRKGNVQAESGEKDTLTNLWMILPLIPRTIRMIDAANELEKERDKLFEPLRNFERIVSEFITNKEIKIGNEGELSILINENGELLEPEYLSSGEKQILILLIQALVEQGKPITYVADEPELSLHVAWQERLLKSIRELAPDFQIIVATHSPDIVGPFQDKIINLEAAR